MANPEIFGLKEVVGKLEKLPDEAQKVVSQAFKMGLRLVMKDAKENHPKWPDKIFNPDNTWRYHNITTNLTNSINMRMRQTKDVIEGDVGVLQEIVRGDAMEYASKIERDHPFIGPAVKAQKTAWLKGIEDALRIYFK